MSRNRITRFASIAARSAKEVLGKLISQESELALKQNLKSTEYKIPKPDIPSKAQIRKLEAPQRSQITKLSNQKAPNKPQDIKLKNVEVRVQGKINPRIRSGRGVLSELGMSGAKFSSVTAGFNNIAKQYSTFASKNVAKKDRLVSQEEFIGEMEKLASSIQEHGHAEWAYANFANMITEYDLSDEQKKLMINSLIGPYDKPDINPDYKVRYLQKHLICRLLSDGVKISKGHALKGFLIGAIDFNTLFSKGYISDLSNIELECNANVFYKNIMLRQESSLIDSYDSFVAIKNFTKYLKSRDCLIHGSYIGKGVFPSIVTGLIDSGEKEKLGILFNKSNFEYLVKRGFDPNSVLMQGSERFKGMNIAQCLVAFGYYNELKEFAKLNPNIDYFQKNPSGISAFEEAVILGREKELKFIISESSRKNPELLAKEMKKIPDLLSDESNLVTTLDRLGINGNKICHSSTNNYKLMKGVESSILAIAANRNKISEVSADYVNKLKSMKESIIDPEFAAKVDDVINDVNTTNMRQMLMGTMTELMRCRNGRKEISKMINEYVREEEPKTPQGSASGDDKNTKSAPEEGKGIIGNSSSSSPKFRPRLVPSGVESSQSLNPQKSTSYKGK